MRSIILSLVFACFFHIGFAQTFSAGSCELNIVIPDNNPSGANATVAVSIGGADALGSDVVLDQVNLFVSHNWGVDLELRLISPNNDTVKLADNRLGNCSYGSACTNLNFRDDGANGPIQAAPGGFGCADVTGAYIPEELLSGFNNGSAASGNWTLFAVDNNTADAGQIEGVELVFVAAPSCPDPTSLAVSNDDANTAEVTFIGGTVSSTYTVQYGTTGFTPGSGMNVAGPTLAGTNTANLSGLSPETTYDVYVSDNCPSNLVGPVSFTTGPANDLCSGAETLTCGATLGGSTANAHTSTPSAGDCGAGAITSGGVWYTYTGTNNQVTISLCSPNTNFDTQLSLYKRSCGDLVCVGGNDDGATFGSGGPCQQAGGGTGGADFLSELTFLADVDTTYFILVHGAGSSTGDFDITLTCAAPCTAPSNDACSSAKTVGVENFNSCSALVGETNVCANPAQTVPSCFQGQVVYDVWYTFNSGGNSELRFILANNSLGVVNATLYDGCSGAEDDCQNDVGDTLDISNLVPGTDYWLQLWSSNGEQGSFNLCLQKTAPCPPPASLAAQNLSTTSATLRFVTSEAGGEYIIEYGADGFTVGTGTIMTGTTVLGTNNVAVTGLSANTAYQYYVKMVCSGSDTSSLAGPLNFTTTCETFTAPHTFDLDNASITQTGNELNCFTFAVSSTGESWQIGSSADQGPSADYTSGSGLFLFADDTESPATSDLSFETAEVDVSGLTTPELQFFLFSDNSFSTVTLTVDIYDGLSYNNAEFTHNSGSTGGWAEVRVDLSGLTISGNVKARFNVDEDNGTSSNDLAIDAITFRESPVCGSPDNDLPTITCPSDITQCSGTVTFLAPAGLDNCPGATTTQTAGLASGSTFPTGATVQQFTVTDTAMNTATCSFTVTVNSTVSAVADKVSAAVGGFTGVIEKKDHYGESVAYIGDVNGDGFPDMAVGAKGDDDSGIPGKKGSGHGCVYILMLNSDNSVISHQKISADSGNFRGPIDKKDAFGSAVAGIGDIDGDGTPDIAIGAMLDDDGPGGTKGKDHGAVYIIRLNTDGTVKGSNKISADSGAVPITLDKKELFGRSIAGIGDLDNDGTPDIAVGAHLSNVFSPTRGKAKKRVGSVYIVNLMPNGHAKAFTQISTDTPALDALLNGKDVFGVSVANLGDFNGDGTNDIVVGAELDDDGPSGTKGSDHGAAYIITLNTNGTPNTVAKISSAIGGFAGPLEKKDKFGAAVTGIGDYNDDGTPDIAVSAMLDDDPVPGDKGKDQGAVYVLTLNPNGSVKTESKISGALAGFPGVVDQKDFLGRSLAATEGDCNTIITAGAIQDDDFPVGGKNGKDNGAIWNFLIPEVFGSSDPLAQSASKDDEAQLLSTEVKLLDTEEGDLQILVYPNPNSGQCVVKLSGAVENVESILLFDQLGKLVSGEQFNGETTKTFDLSDYAEGMYFMHIGSTKNKVVHKILISR